MSDMISENRSEKIIHTELEIPLDEHSFTHVISEIIQINQKMEQLKKKCRKKIKGLQIRKKELEKNLLQRKQSQQKEVLEVKLFDEGKKQFWIQEKLIHEVPLTNQDMQVSLFDYLG